MACSNTSTHPDHTHGPNCGHTAIKHGDHVDYLHDGHLHHPHEDHYDEHSLDVSKDNPDECNENSIAENMYMGQDVVMRRCHMAII